MKTTRWKTRVKAAAAKIGLEFVHKSSGTRGDHGSAYTVRSPGSTCSIRIIAPGVVDQSFNRACWRTSIGGSALANKVAADNQQYWRARTDKVVLWAASIEELFDKIRVDIVVASVIND